MVRLVVRPGASGDGVPCASVVLAVEKGARGEGHVGVSLRRQLSLGGDGSAARPRETVPPAPPAAGPDDSAYRANLRLSGIADAHRPPGGSRARFLDRRDRPIADIAIAAIAAIAGAPDAAGTPARVLVVHGNGVLRTGDRLTWAPRSA